MSCSWDPRFDSHDMILSTNTCILAFREYDCFPKICILKYISTNHCFAGESNPGPFSFAWVFSPLGHIADSNNTDYSLILKTTLSVHFTTVHANLIEQTTSSIELVVLKRCIIVVIRKDSRCLLLHQLEQHRCILLSKETYRTLAQPADPCGNHSGDMISKIPNPTLRIDLNPSQTKSRRSSVRNVRINSRTLFFDLVPNICLIHFLYLLRLSILCKAPLDMRKFPQKCQKIAGC